MAKTDIEYGDRTWNPLTGCTKVSEGCKHCWAETMAKRLKAMGRAEYQDAVDEKGNWTGKITLLPERLKEPLTWRKPQHVLVEYMGDLFHENVPDEYIWDVFSVMDKTPQHTYQILTKRPERMKSTIIFRVANNVILGCTIENQKRADERLPFMRKMAERGWRTWVSYEPALGNVDWKGWEFLNQLVAGGESGPGARPMHPDWMRSARDWCIVNEVPFFFKQWGNWHPGKIFYREGWVGGGWFEGLSCAATGGAHPLIDKRILIDPDNKELGWMNVGKKIAGRELDGREWSEMPAPSALSGTSPILEKRQNGGGQGDAEVAR